MDFKNIFNDMNISDIDEYFLNSTLKPAIKENIQDYLINIDFVDINKKNFTLSNIPSLYPPLLTSYNRTERIIFTLNKNERILHDFYGMLKQYLNRMFISIFTQIISEKYCLFQHEETNISNRKIKIENLLNYTSYNLNEYIEKDILSYSKYDNISVLYLGTDDNFHKLIPKKEIEYSISDNTFLWEKIGKIYNYSFYKLPLSQLFNNMILLTNTSFIDFFFDENSYKYNFSEFFRNRAMPNDIYNNFPYHNYDERITFTLNFDLNYSPKIEIFKILKINYK